MPCVTSDMFPTIMNLLGDTNFKTNLPQDGMNILPALFGSQTVRDKPIGFAYGANTAWVTQTHKLHTNIKDGRWNNVELFDLINDPYEEKNIAKDNPELVSQMKIALNSWIISCNKSCGNRYHHLPVPDFE